MVKLNNDILNNIYNELNFPEKLIFNETLKLSKKPKKFTNNFIKNSLFNLNKKINKINKIKKIAYRETVFEYDISKEGVFEEVFFVIYYTNIEKFYSQKCMKNIINELEYYLNNDSHINYNLAKNISKMLNIEEKLEFDFEELKFEEPEDDHRCLDI